ncbi:hypothetical protein GHT06_011503 [Daphnia sinensis]|uniref:Uncharacterized protein n=1 Tax=Daphnia sinensis TaxID=1820382 RepID=A0AAD5LE52_9CRUS|nr:hypothetical protein GHT06_011503 [Daphnia sinensis]
MRTPPDTDSIGSVTTPLMKGVMAPGCTARTSPCSTWLMSSSWNICMSGSAICCCDDLDRTGCLRSSKTWTVDSMRRDDPSLAVQLIKA